MCPDRKERWGFPHAGVVKAASVELETGGGSHF